jgi:hypothetical protein
VTSSTTSSADQTGTHQEGTTVTQPDPFGSADDFFSGGSPSISFKGDHQLNVPKGGQIIRIGDKQQQLDYSTKKPELWDDGTPKMVLPIELATTERDPQDPHDDGARTLWVGEGTGLKSAVAQALRATRSKLRPGGTLMVAWVSGKGEKGDPKQYQAQYTPPAPGAVAADSMFGEPAPQPAAPAWPPAPAQAAPAAAAPQPQWGATPPAPQPQWGATPPAPQPVAAAVPQQPAAPTPAAFDPAAIDAAYAHLTDGQRHAIKLSMQSGMTFDQVIGVFGPPSGAVA